MARLPISLVRPRLTSCCSAPEEAFPAHAGDQGEPGHLLGALSRLALALVVQDALDQVVVLIQHLEER